MILLMVNPSCGRKYRNIFFFNSEKSCKLEKLTFPAVKGVTIDCVEQCITISWRPIDNLSNGVVLVGYNIYRLTQDGFIPRKPINQAPIGATKYCDVLEKKRSMYLIKAVFRVGTVFKEGPASFIVSSF